MKLAACSHCARHIRVTETRCPFCGGEVTPRAEGGILPNGVRAAIVVGLMVGSGIALSACYGCPTPSCGPVDTGVDDSATE